MDKEMNMYKIRQLSLVSVILLAACAPPKASFQIENLEQAKKSEQPQQEKTTVLSSDSPTTSLPSTKQTVNSTVKLSSNQAPAAWDLSGAMAAKNKNKAWTASINWLQRGSGTYQIRLNGPLGSGAILVEKKGSTITFRDGPKSARSTNADELLNQQTGIRLPVNNLFYWVRGIPAPGTVQTVKRDAANNIQVLKQGGYIIEYSGYKMINNASLPTQIRLQGNGVFIKLVIKNWKV